MSDAPFRWDTLVAVVIAIAGWAITDKLSARRQRHAIRDQVRNEARLSINKAFEHYTRWLSEHAAICEVLSNATDEFSSEALRELAELGSDARGSEWMFRLSEHEALFPETRRLGQELARRNGEINFHLMRLIGVDPELSFADRNEFVYNILRLAMIQGLVVSELRTYLQNVSLGRLFGTEVKTPRYDDSGPHLMRDSSTGQLRVDYDKLLRSNPELAARKPQPD